MKLTKTQKDLGIVLLFVFDLFLIYALKTDFFKLDVIIFLSILFLFIQGVLLMVQGIEENITGIVSGVELNLIKNKLPVEIIEVKPSLLEFVKELVSHITMNVFGTNFKLLVCEDKKNIGGRIYLQVDYEAPCTKTNNLESWKGRKWYLSEFMTDDEIVKTAYCAFQAAVTHEIMEGFKFDNVIVFNPHINFRELLKVSHLEIKRN